MFRSTKGGRLKFANISNWHAGKEFVRQKTYQSNQPGSLSKWSWNPQPWPRCPAPSLLTKLSGFLCANGLKSLHILCISWEISMCIQYLVGLLPHAKVHCEALRFKRIDCNHPNFNLKECQKRSRAASWNRDTMLHEDRSLPTTSNHLVVRLPLCSGEYANFIPWLVTKSELWHLWRR